MWRPGVLAIDATIDVPSRVPADGSACRPGLPESVANGNRHVLAAAADYLTVAHRALAA